MKKNRLLENLNQSVGSNIPMKRYNLADMISESYKMIYKCNEGTNLKRLAESHLDDVRQNPREIERLSRQLCILKEVSRMVESNDLKDEDLVDKKSFDTVEPKEDRVIVQKECNECDDPKINEGSPRRRNRCTKESCASKKESIKEVDDPELTDEELEELAKHLETIRKERKNAPKTEMKEDTTTSRDIKCTDSNKPDKEINEADTPESWVAQYGVDILYTEGQEDVEYKIEYALTKAGLKVLGCQSTDTSWSTEEYEKLTGISAKDILGESKEEKIEDCNESKSYRGLENFKKQSESKAFYKTFKKMHESLKEGKALTRQESIDLYKASNSALTQLSIELEHNPGFLDTFRESVSLLSKDVSSLLESLTRGKAPSKATMKSLSKFSESLLYEEDHPEYASDFKVLDTILVGPDYTIQICDVVDTYSDAHYGVQVVDNDGEPVNSKEIDDLTFDKFFKTEAEAREIANKLVPILSTKYSVNESEEGNKSTGDTYEGEYKGAKIKITSEDVAGRGVYVDGKLYYMDGGSIDKVLDRLKKSLDKNEEEYRANKESARREGSAQVVFHKGGPVNESDEEDFVGDDEGDVQSEEADAFDQEYADARVELHKDLEDKHADDEDPEVQDKLAQDADEVINLPGTTEEQIAQINGEESTEGDNIEEEPEEEDDDSEITDDELEELKKHLKEMRSIKKTQ